MKTFVSAVLSVVCVLSVSRLYAAPLSVEKEAAGGFTVKVGGEVFAKYVIDQANKPYLWPVYGPTGKLMTRAYPMEKVDGEQKDHPHHRGIFFGHEEAGGGNTWHEELTYEEVRAKNEKQAKLAMERLGKIVHREFKELKVEGDAVVCVEVCDHLDAGGKRFAQEERRLVFRAGPEVRSIDFDQDLSAEEGGAVFEDRKDAGLAIRIPTSMAVDGKQGGGIVNSNGARDAEAWGKAAKWCDYSGPVGGERVGVAIFSHPSTYRFPSTWHVRTYGLFGANPFCRKGFDKAVEAQSTRLEAGAKLKLRHRFVFHKGDEKTGGIEAAYQAYSAEAR